MPTQDDLFIPTAKRHHRRKTKLLEFTQSTTRAAGIMLIAAVIALVVMNTDLHIRFETIWSTMVGFFVGDLMPGISVGMLINDALMALFFLLVGLEIKYEFTVGSLTDVRQALLPVLAAAGGVLAPIVIYLLFNGGTPFARGWGIPMATDIAFALGILALLGSRIPVGLYVFLSTLAIADDIVAIIAIALFYGETINIFWIAMAATVWALLILLNRLRIYSMAPYILGGIVLWVCVFFSGIHATIAGVLLAFTIPTGSQIKLQNLTQWVTHKVERAKGYYHPGEPALAQKEYLKEVTTIETVSCLAAPPLLRLERKLHSWVYFLVLPLFALSNAGVRLVDENVLIFMLHPVALGVFFGLVVGKPIGIMLASLLTVKLGLCKLPKGVTWGHMLGVAFLGGIGFTMAIFIANLAFIDIEVTLYAKTAILSASVVSGILGFLVLRFQTMRQVHTKDVSRMLDE